MQVISEILNFVFVVFSTSKPNHDKYLLSARMYMATTSYVEADKFFSILKIK